MCAAASELTTDRRPHSLATPSAVSIEYAYRGIEPIERGRQALSQRLKLEVAAHVPHSRDDRFCVDEHGFNCGCFLRQ
jgi:hypothetical protein